ALHPAPARSTNRTANPPAPAYSRLSQRQPPARRHGYTARSRGASSSANSEPPRKAERQRRRRRMQMRRSSRFDTLRRTGLGSNARLAQDKIRCIALQNESRGTASPRDQEREQNRERQHLKHQHDQPPDCRPRQLPAQDRRERDHG